MSLSVSEGSQAQRAPMPPSPPSVPPAAPYHLSLLSYWLNSHCIMLVAQSQLGAKWGNSPSQGNRNLGTRTHIFRDEFISPRTDAKACSSLSAVNGGRTRSARMQWFMWLSSCQWFRSHTGYDMGLLLNHGNCHVSQDLEIQGGLFAAQDALFWFHFSFWSWLYLPENILFTTYSIHIFQMYWNKNDLIKILVAIKYPYRKEYPADHTAAS